VVPDPQKRVRREGSAAYRVRRVEVLSIESEGYKNIAQPCIYRLRIGMIEGYGVICVRIGHNLDLMLRDAGDRG
jgi:hypothetical protein